MFCQLAVSTNTMLGQRESADNRHISAGLGTAPISYGEVCAYAHTPWI